MPALLGYLFAIAIFLGGGYAGIAWLASPESRSAYHSPSEKPASHRKNTRQSNLSATQVAEGDGNPATSDGTNTSAAPAGEKPKDADVSMGDGKIANGQDSVPSGGCMPIGLTAQGDMVFPLQCRELLEQQRGPISSAVTAPAPKESERPDSKKPAGSSDTQIGSDMRKPPEPKASVFNTDMEKYASRPTSATGPEPVGTSVKANRNANLSAASAYLKESEPNNASPAGALKPDFPTAKAGIGLQRRSTGALAQRSRLVRMTLRTIEYPDGHREQHLLPIKHAQRVTLETEDQWYNPLGLR
jgi:hypothetical protein